MADADIIVVGGGAAGLAAAVFAARRNPRASILILDGARRLGAKILVSGGGRCNVTNAVVTPEDFRGSWHGHPARDGSRNGVRRVLAAFPVEQTVEFFKEVGVTLHEEENGKLFPDTNSARTVLDALLNEAQRHAVQIRTAHRVQSVRRVARDAAMRTAASSSDTQSAARGFALSTPTGEFETTRLVLATGGMSLPKTGSDGTGYRLARQLGHSLVPATPALVPLVLDGEFHKPLSGIAHPAEITVRPRSGKAEHFRGSMLWTHFGISGPVVLDASGCWHRMRLNGMEPSVSANLIPYLPGREAGGTAFERADRWLVESAAGRPRAALQTILAEALPARLAEAVLARLGSAARVPMAHLSRDDRRRLVHALLDWPLPVHDSRGYSHAEVTSGGVPLSEVDPATMRSRACPGLYLIGEILDVDGRIGGFNFQWAWSSGYVVGHALSAQGH